MKHLKFNTFLLTLLLSMAGITAAAHDIEVENEHGIRSVGFLNPTASNMSIYNAKQDIWLG